MSARPDEAIMSWIPYLLDLELLLSLRHVAACTGFGVLHLGRSSRICHLDVGHDGSGDMWGVARRYCSV